jgi:uncharacterized MAPEG superfamily protein
MTLDLGGLVYGTILIATLLSAEVAKRESYPRTIGAVMIAMLLYWLTHSYATFTAQRAEAAAERAQDTAGRAEASERVQFSAFVAAARHDVSVFLGGVPQLVVLVVLWAAGVPLGTALSADIWLSVAMIVGVEVLIGVRAELTGWHLVQQTAFGVLIGVLLVSLRILLH